MKNSVLRIVEKRFGAVPADARQRIEAIRDATELEALLDRALSAASLNDLGLAPA
ncbi:MAG: DUF4351 domain-containing protein [Armatimonadetes bacterium]|nr:DUF4351 domain-containing protein [Armatimonadota bacterium]